MKVKQFTADSASHDLHTRHEVPPDSYHDQRNGALASHVAQHKSLHDLDLVQSDGGFRSHSGELAAYKTPCGSSGHRNGVLDRLSRTCHAQVFQLSKRGRGAQVG